MNDSSFLLEQNYKEVINEIKKHGFYDAVAFKGFSAKEKGNFNILLYDRYSSEEELIPQAHRKLDLSDKLSDLLKCNVFPVTEGSMDPLYLARLNQSNSLKLANTVPAEDIKKVFGDYFSFKDVNKNTIFSVKELQKEDEKKILVEKLKNYVVEKSKWSEKFDIDNFFDELKQEVKNSAISECGFGPSQKG